MYNDEKIYDIKISEIKPSNLTINLYHFCKGCEFFKPEIESIDYTTSNGLLELEAYTLMCDHKQACLKHNEFKNYISYNNT